MCGTSVAVWLVVKGGGVNTGTAQGGGAGPKSGVSSGWPSVYGT